MVRPRGFRELFADDLMDVRYTTPCRRLQKGTDAYLKAIKVRRPVFAIHQIAKYSESLLAQVRAIGDPSPYLLGIVEDLFFEVRNAEREILAECDPGTTYPRDRIGGLRTRAQGLMDMAVSTSRVVKGALEWCVCPCCGGSGRVRGDKARTVREAVSRATENTTLTNDLPG